MEDNDDSYDEEYEEGKEQEQILQKRINNLESKVAKYTELALQSNQLSKQVATAERAEKYKNDARDALKKKKFYEKLLEKETEKKINLEMKLIDKDIAKQKEILKKMEEDFHRKIAVLTGSTVTEEDSPPDLTIDMDIQNSLERELENAYLKYNPESIIGIAMDPNTGEIKALSNRPTYNPNNYKEYDQDIYNKNLSVWKCFEPGSTFKVFSFAAALEEKKIDMYKDTYNDKGFEIVGGRTIKSWKKGGHGLQTFLEVLENSSNPGFVEISRRLGCETLYD
jgi:membrane peptidoglycan carboxypeptidase